MDINTLSTVPGMKSQEEHHVLLSMEDLTRSL